MVLKGTIVAIVNNTMALTHCIISVDTLNSRIKIGKVTVVAVLSKIPKKAKIPVAKMANTTRLVSLFSVNSSIYKYPNISYFSINLTIKLLRILHYLYYTRKLSNKNHNFIKSLLNFAPYA